MRLIASVRRDCAPVFVTLTYPERFPGERQAKRDLDVFIKRLGRRFPDVAGVWKIEPQQRGAPHFHLLIWNVPLHELRKFVPLAWHEIAGQGDPKHLLWHLGGLGNQFCVQPARKGVKAFWYASKYISKEVAQDCQHWGRWWGVFFRERLPFGQVLNIPVSEEKAIEFIRYMRRYANLPSRDYKSLTIICDPKQWLDRLLG